MKKLNKFSISIVLLSMIIINNCLGQSDIASTLTGHVGASNTSYYCGWDANTTFDLDIKHLNSKNINFYTKNTKYMTILGSTNPGYVGIGTATPSNLLHLYNSGTGAALYSQWSNGNATHTSGMIVGINGSNEGVMNMQDNRPINFLTNNLRRGRITSGGNFLLGAYNSFTVNNQLVQYAGANTATYHQFVASNSNTAATDGFKIGITFNGNYMDAELISQQQSANMNFYTNGSGTITKRMAIAA